MLQLEIAPNHIQEEVLRRVEAADKSYDSLCPAAKVLCDRHRYREIFILKNFPPLTWTATGTQVLDSPSQ